MEFKDYYATLGVPKSRLGDDIKRAFRKLARKHHPDLNPGDKAAEAKFKDVNEANEVLGDSEKRKKYDELGANWRMYEQAQGTGAPAGGRSANASGPRRHDLPHDDGGRDAGHVRGTAIRSRISSTRSSAARDAARAAGGGSRARRGQDARLRRRAHSRRSVLGHDAAGRRSTRDGAERTVDVRIPAGVNGRRPRARRRRRRPRARWRDRRPVSARPHPAARALRAPRTGFVGEGARAGADRGPRGRSHGPGAERVHPAARRCRSSRRTAGCSGCGGTACRRSARRSSAATCTPPSKLKSPLH